MSDDSNITPALGTKGGLAYIDSTNTPIIYFDGVSCYGATQGVVEIELVIRTMAPTIEGGVVVRLMPAGRRLRFSSGAAKALRQSLDAATPSAEQPQPGQVPEPPVSPSQLN
jgi:hypothetical protein